MTNPLANREARTVFNYELAAKGIPEKVCSRCITIKPHSAFGKFASSADGLRSFCRACRSVDHKDRYHSDPEYRAKHTAAAIRWQKSNPARVGELVSARKAHQRRRNANKIQNPNVFKRCAGCCGQLLPETAFRLDRGQRDGLRTTCRTCTTGYRHACRKAHGSPDGQACYLCGAIISGNRNAWVDHVLPRSKGGGDEPENLRWTHAACNMRRGTAPLTAEQMARLNRSPR